MIGSLRKTMKKSEVIRIVYDTINANLKYDNVSTSREIINELEKAGMHPPCRLCENNVHGEFPQEENCEFDWEPEDEEK